MAMIGLKSEDDASEEDGCMFGPRKGSWTISSASDPRWNASGEASLGFGTHPDAKKAIAALRRKYGKPPADLSYFSMKY